METVYTSYKHLNITLSRSSYYLIDTAEIAASLDMAPETLSAIAERLKMDEKELEPMLKDMSLSGKCKKRN